MFRWMLQTAVRSQTSVTPSFARATAARSFSSDASRPFRILGLQQVALGGLQKKTLENFWCHLLGVPKVSTFRSEKENVDEDILRLGNGPYAVEIDIMQPIDANKAPKVHDPALNHIGLWVDDLKACVAHLDKQGVRFTPGGIRKGAAGYDVCFIHPKGTSPGPDGSNPKPIGACGVLVELVQAPPEVIAALGGEEGRSN